MHVDELHCEELAKVSSILSGISPAASLRRMSASSEPLTPECRHPGLIWF